MDMKLKKIISKFGEVHWLFAVIAMVFGISLVFLTPPLWGADESVHVFRAYQISEGRLNQDEQVINGKKSYSGYTPSSFVKLSNLFSRDINNNLGDARQVDDVSEYIKIGSVTISKDTKVANPLGAVTYPAISYLAPSLGMMVANPFNPTALVLLYSARLATLFMYILLVSLSILLIKNKSAKWIIFVAALLPTCLYQSSVVNVDSLLFALGFVLFSLTYNLIYENKNRGKYYMILLLLSAGLLTLIKPPYVILILPLVLLPMGNKTTVTTRKIVRYVIPAVCLIIAVVGTISVQRIISTPLPYTSLAGQLHWILSNPFGYIATIARTVVMINWPPLIIGTFGSSFILMPWLVVDSLMLILVATAFIKISANHNEDREETQHTKLSGLMFILASALTCLAVATTLFLTWTHIGGYLVEGIQGRYFIPAICFVLLGLRMITKTRLVVSEKNAKIFFASVTTLCLMCSVLWYYKILY